MVTKTYCRRDVYLLRQLKISLNDICCLLINCIHVTDQYKEEILSQLKNIPNFLNEAFVKNLLSVTSLIGNSGNQSNALLGALDPLHLGSYLHTTTKTVADGLTKVAEATSKYELHKL